MPLQLSSTVLDRNAEFRGILTRKLMENAGKQAAKLISRKFGKPTKVQIFCGGGGNGGDGFVVAAELLRKRIPVEVFPLAEIRNTDAQFYFGKLPKNVVRKFSGETKIDAPLLVDAILGVGARGKLREPIATVVKKLKQARGKIISLDVPTGDLSPKLTIAFHASKKSPLNPPFTKGGKRGTASRKNSRQTKQGDFYPEVVVPIGIPQSAEKFFGPGDVWEFFPRRKSDSHKGENGRVVIVGGSREFVGAPIFTAFGALAAGVDLIDIFVPAVNFSAARKFAPNFLVHEFSGETNFLTVESAREIVKFARAKNATLVVGPGLGRDDRTRAAVKFFAENWRGPLVLDADALDENLRKFASQKIVLTPHAGESRRLPKNLNAVILKKGRVDEIIFGREKRWNDSGSAILTVGGSGDTLAGLVGGLLARGFEPFNAAGVAAFLLGTAGEKIALKSEGTTPQMLAKKIPEVIQAMLK
ncbi:MAG: NAD(P)H-hydrate dehydratase [Patescibacteria group bacterium]